MVHLVGWSCIWLVGCVFGWLVVHLGLTPGSGRRNGSQHPQKTELTNRSILGQNISDLGFSQLVHYLTVEKIDKSLLLTEILTFKNQNRREKYHFWLMLRHVAKIQIGGFRLSRRI